LKTSLLQIKNLSVDFISDNARLPDGQEFIHAAKNISFAVNRGEITALVGESGSGKTVTSLSILQLLASPPASYSSGEILFSEDGNNVEDLLKKDTKKLKHIRGNKIAMIFQEPMSSLNPVFTCGHQIIEAILSHKKISKKEARQQTIQWLSKVRLPHPEKIFYRYPHQLSGGQKQRLSIARALIKDSSILIFDDCLSAVDAKTEKQILNNLQEVLEQKTAIIITHRIFSLLDFDQVIVLDHGKIVEQGTHDKLLSLNGYYAELYRRQQSSEVNESA